MYAHSHKPKLKGQTPITTDKITILGVSANRGVAIRPCSYNTISDVIRLDACHINRRDARPRVRSHTDTLWTSSLFIRVYKKVRCVVAAEQLLGRCAAYVPSAGNAYRALQREWDTLGPWHALPEDPPTTNQRRSFKVKLYLNVVSVCWI